MTELHLVIDISNLVNRAYHAAKAGKDAVSYYGLAKYNLNRMMKTLLRDTDPYRLVGALDCGRSFRHDLYPEYKGHRGEKDAELRQLLADAPRLLWDEYGMELFQAQGFEADDVLATIADANLAGCGDVRTVIATNDQDALQLVYAAPGRAGTYVLQYEKGAYWSIGPAEVEAKLGVPPHRVALLKALMGDASDNIKGVEGIGKVAARRIALQFASPRAVFAGLERLQKSDRTKLEACGFDGLERLYRLTRLATNAPLQQVAHEVLAEAS